MKLILKLTSFVFVLAIANTSNAQVTIGGKLFVPISHFEGGDAKVVAIESRSTVSDGKITIQEKNNCPSTYKGGTLGHISSAQGILSNATIINGVIHIQTPTAQPLGSSQTAQSGSSINTFGPPFPEFGITKSFANLFTPAVYFYQMRCGYINDCPELGPNVNACSFAPIYFVGINLAPPSNLNLSISPENKFSALPSEATANSKFSVKPNVPTTLNVFVTGSGFKNPETRTAVVTLQIGNLTQLTKTISLTELKAMGTLSVEFQHTFTAEDAGEVSLAATVNSPEDTNSSDNSATDKMYVLCNVEDFGRIVPFYGQAESPWGNDPFGNVLNSSKPGTMKSYGCSVTDFAMLMESYGIRTTPLGSPLNPTLNGVSTIPGLKGEAMTPRTLNQAFTNYKTAFTGIASVALNSANDPVWEGMAEVARAGYQAQCANPANNCDPANAPNVISFKSAKLQGYDNTSGSADQKKIIKEICTGNPVILKFAKATVGQHFMLSTGMGVDAAGKVVFRLNNPGDLRAGRNQRQDQIANRYPSIMGYMIYHPSNDPSMMNIAAPLNVHFVVTDPLGRRSGYDPTRNISYSEIPGSTYGVQSIDTPAEPEYLPETLVAERYFMSNSDTLAGLFQIETFALQSGSYYLDIRTTDAAGYANDASYMTGTLTAGQSEILSLMHSHETVPEPNAELDITHYNLKQRDEGRFEVGIDLGGKIKPFNSSVLSLKNRFNLTIGGVNGYKLSIPASQFKSSKTSGKSTYTYLDQEVKIVLTPSGEFNVSIEKADLTSLTPEKDGYIRVDVDSTFSSANVSLKCKKDICNKDGK